MCCSSLDHPIPFTAQQDENALGGAAREKPSPLSPISDNLFRPMAEYRVNLEIYNGPMDLLLYLIRRDEVDVHDIPIARITEQYLQYVEMLQEINPDVAGEFLVLAATLLEIKTRMLLPPPAREDASEGLMLDPRAELVRQLLQYKAFKDAAGMLEDAAEQHAARYARTPSVPEADPSAVDLEDLQVWDLVEAFGKLLDSIGHRPTHHQVIYDDTPLELHQEDLLDRLRREGPLRFSEVFQGRSRSEMVGLFLAMLELVRLHKIVASQEIAFGEIHVYANPNPIAAGPSEPLAASQAVGHDALNSPEVPGDGPADPLAASQVAAPDTAEEEPPPAQGDVSQPPHPREGDGTVDPPPSVPPAPDEGRYVPQSPTPDQPEHEDERGTEDQGTGV
jgi:segregation and condensation protein A